MDMADRCRVGPHETVVQQDRHVHVSLASLRQLSGLGRPNTSAGISLLYGEEKKMATSSEIYVGIDVSKDKLDVAVLGEARGWQEDNTQAGIAKLVQQMQELCSELIVVEATGGYQRAVVEALFHAGLSVAVANPTRVRQFARACGLLAKTDKLDAQLLAVFGQRVQPKLYTGKSEAEKQLSALLVRRRQVEEMLKAEQNRLRTISPSLRSSVERMIAILKEEKKHLDDQIQQFLNEQKAWQEQREILSSAPGVGRSAVFSICLPSLPHATTR